MKIRPGTRIRPEKRKNQFRLPMMSNTSASLPSAESTDHGSGLELLVAYAEEPGFLDAPLAHHKAHQGPRYGDGGEHRRCDTDDQNQGKSLDRGRSAHVQNGGGDQRRHVRVEDRVPGSAEARLARRGKRLAGA